jgi:hypothetical protein
MANRTKITPEIADQIRALASEHTATAIGRKFGLAKDTIKNWCLKNNIPLALKRREGYVEKERVFCEMLRNGYTAKQAQIAVGVGDQTSVDFIKRNNLQQYVRTREQVVAEDMRLSGEDLKKRLPSEDYSVIGYENGKYIVKAPDGFVFTRSSTKKRWLDPRQTAVTTEEKIAKELKEISYTYISGFVKKRKPFLASHDVCGLSRARNWLGFKNSDCPRCSNNGVSKKETELANWIAELGLETQKFKFFNENKTRPKEIDIYIPSKGVGIEFCGLYWHSEEMKGKQYHKDKLDLAKKAGIRLITVFEDEWDLNKDQVKNFIKSVLGTTAPVYARNCIVNEISSKKARNFFKQNHIQGAPRSVIYATGLFYENNLIGVMSLGTHHRGGQNKDIVLNRLAFSEEFHVIGGASKLLKKCVEWSKKEGYEKIISWSDNRWSEGNVYKKMGFQLEKELNTDYDYIKAGKRYKKHSLKKTASEKLLNKTEKELRESQGYGKIWDCGKIRWSLKIKVD